MGKNDLENSENEIDPLDRRERSTARSIPDRVAQFYYFLGLFCSTYPVLIVTAAISVVLISWYAHIILWSQSISILKLNLFVFSYPLLSLPLPGNRPQYFSTPYKNYKIPFSVPNSGESNTISGDGWPRWYKDSPAVFVQQILIKSSVLPWSDNLILTDAFRGPLAESFHFLEVLKNIKPSNT